MRRLTKEQRDEWRAGIRVRAAMVMDNEADRELTDALDDLDAADQELEDERDARNNASSQSLAFAIKERDELRAKLAEADRKLAASEVHLQIQASIAGEFRAKLASTEVEVRDALGHERDDLETECEELRAKLAEAETRRDAFDEGWKREMELRGDNLITIEELKAKLAEADKAIEQACQQLDQKDEQLGEMRKKLAEAEAKLAVARDALEWVTKWEVDKPKLKWKAREALAKIGGE